MNTTENSEDRERACATRQADQPRRASCKLQTLQSSPTAMLVMCAVTAPAALLAGRIPPPSMLLGADGKPLKSGDGGGSASASPSPGKGLILDGGKTEYSAGLAAGVAQNIAIAGGDSGGHTGAFSPDELPDDLKDFDPTFDPLAAPRPKYDFCAASGRPTESVYGSIAPESSDTLERWATFVRGAGTTRLLGLFSSEEASARSSDGTPQGAQRRFAPPPYARSTHHLAAPPPLPLTGFFADLQGVGFDAANIGLLDPRADGAREATLTMLHAAVAAREQIVVCCADGHKLTAIVLADWLLTDYIGGENYDEACHALAMRKRLAGVERRADPAELERWMTTGKL